MVRRSHDEALWYLDRLAGRGGDWSVFADRAEVHGRRGDQALRDADLKRALALGGEKQRDFALKVAEEWARQNRWAEAARLLSAAHQAHPGDGSLLHRLALAHLKAGDRAAHAELCKRTLLELPPKRNAMQAVFVFRLCILSPGAVENWKELVQPLERVVGRVKADEQRVSGAERQELQKLRREWQVTLAALLHRDGRSAEAIQHLNEVIKLIPGGEEAPVEWAWLALAHAATEKAPGKGARHWLEQARAALPKRDGEGLWQAVLVEILVAEAGKVLEGTKDR
jgi:tetratricopeptide (TPR) repeat protein